MYCFREDARSAIRCWAVCPHARTAPQNWKNCAGSRACGWMLPSIIWAGWPVRRRPSGMRAVYDGAFCTPNIMPHRGQQWKWASGWQSWPLAVRCECRVQSCCRNWWRACPLDMTASFLCRHPAQPAATMCRSSWLCR